jgi:hypothetical protein
MERFLLLLDLEFFRHFLGKEDNVLLSQTELKEPLLAWCLKLSKKKMLT